MNTYTDFVKTVESTSWHQPNERLLHAAMGLCTESAETFECTDQQHSLEELGDVCWYIALGLDAIGRSWEDAPILTEAVFLDMVRGEDAAVSLTLHSTDILDMVKKAVFYGKAIDQDKLYDSFVMVKNVISYGMIFSGMPYTLDEVVNANVKKLTARYPGKFTEEAAVNRDVKEEYAAMSR
jgi:NTP pyrophosphatase (non-canonical NTP hydrolase)